MSGPLRIAQISDIHCGTILFDRDLIVSTVERVNGMAPDLVIVAGDLTADGYEWEFEEAADWLGRLEAPVVVVPGNHDARNLGYLHFERLFGDRNPARRLAFEDDRADDIEATGLTVVGVDSSQPDLNQGRIGREWYDWIVDRFSEHPDDIKLFFLHHHLVSIPGTGRERNTVLDAGEVLDVLSQQRIDLVLSGHKHVPFFWGLNGILICNSGTASTHRVRGNTPPSFNEIVVDRDDIEVFLHYGDGRRELSVRRARASRTELRDALQLTSEFRSVNRVDVAAPTRPKVTADA